MGRAPGVSGLRASVRANFLDLLAGRFPGGALALGRECSDSSGTVGSVADRGGRFLLAGLGRGSLFTMAVRGKNLSKGSACAVNGSVYGVRDSRRLAHMDRRKLRRVTHARSPACWCPGLQTYQPHPNLLQVFAFCCFGTRAAHMRSACLILQHRTSSRILLGASQRRDSLESSNFYISASTALAKLQDKGLANSGQQAAFR